MYTFVDRCEADGQPEAAIVVKTIAIKPNQRGKGLSNALMYLAISKGRELGAHYAISATVHSGIQSESYARKGEVLWFHEYALWQKNVT